MENNASMPPQQEPKKSLMRKIPGFRSGKPWKMVIALIGYALMLFIMAGILDGKDSGSTNQPVAQSMANNQSSQAQTKGEKNAPQAAKAEQPTPSPQKPALELIEAKVDSDSYMRYIIGTVKNNSARQYGYVQVEINLYDDAGTQVGSTLANTNNLESSGTWRFKAPVIEENAVNVFAKIKVEEGAIEIT